MRKLSLISLLAILVLLLAACGGTSDVSPEGGESETEVESAPAAPMAVTLEGTNDLKYMPDTISAEADQPVEITLDNISALEHNIVWDDAAEGEVFLYTAAGESATASRTFEEAGEYGFHCSIPGHKEAGMVGTVTITE